MSMLLENKNALPFEAQNHCKLRLEEQKDIHERYVNGESIEDIHESYPFVSEAAIKYWAFNRERDLERRKNSANYTGGETCRDKNYYNDLKQRRIDNGLVDPNSSQGIRSLTGIKLNQEQKREIMELYGTKQYTERSIAKKLNLPVTIVRSVFQSKQYKDEYKNIVKDKKSDKKELFIYIYQLYLFGKSFEDISAETKLSVAYVKNIIYAAKNPQKYINSGLSHIAKYFI